MMQVKGSAIMAMPKFVSEKHGDYGFKKWLDALSPQAKQVYGGHIMANNWYPFKETDGRADAEGCAICSTAGTSRARRKRDATAPTTG